MDQSVDKSLRSVFVGNIPYEATEEKLKEIFSEVGPVNSFKLVYDRESGKPKGYGFCEFKDQETALSAMRNLNGYEIGGRTLRVDNACTEKNRMEMQSLSGGQGQSSLGGGVLGALNENPYGEQVDPERAPESISKAVASLPPENMFELMKQMKLCIQNNPQEARVMLNQNPQLAYALLQAQVVMRIVDPELAVSMLHKTPPRPPNFASNVGMTATNPSGPVNVPSSQPFNQMPPTSMPPQRPPVMDVGMPQQQFGAPPPNVGFNPEGPPAMSGRRDPREDRYGSQSRDPRSRDPRAGYGDRSGASRQASTSAPPPGLPPHLAGAEPEKQQLIMQVLKLTDQQIAMLPADQRESIMQLKKQINAVPM